MSTSSYIVDTMRFDHNATVRALETFIEKERSSGGGFRPPVGSVPEPIGAGSQKYYDVAKAKKAEADAVKKRAECEAAARHPSALVREKQRKDASRPWNLFYFIATSPSGPEDDDA